MKASLCICGLLFFIFSAQAQVSNVFTKASDVNRLEGKIDTLLHDTLYINLSYEYASFPNTGTAGTVTLYDRKGTTNTFIWLPVADAKLLQTSNKRIMVFISRYETVVKSNSSKYYFKSGSIVRFEWKKP